MIARMEPGNRLHAALVYRPPVRRDRSNDPALFARMDRVCEDVRRGFLKGASNG
jgi:hypothetical protein